MLDANAALCTSLLSLQCPSSTYGSYSSTRQYPDDVIFFSRTHPLLQEAVLPQGGRPLFVRVGVHYKFSRLLVDRVEAVDGQYDVLFIGTGVGIGFVYVCVRVSVCLRTVQAGVPSVLQTQARC